MQNSLSTSSGALLPYQLRRSERAKKTRIIVSAHKIEVVAPLHVSERRIKAFVEAHQDWIRETLKRIQHRTSLVNPLAPAHYTEGVTVPYQGQQIPLTIKPTSANTLRLQLLPEPQFLVYLPAAHRENGSELIKRSLENWMKQQTRHHAMQLIAEHGQKHNLMPRNLRIKTLKSRWGSCGPQNDINLNWLLMLAPPVILEYVVVHELCHIKHKNHSQDFWQLVGDHMPDYLRHRHWLKQNGASLMQGL